MRLWESHSWSKHSKCLPILLHEKKKKNKDKAKNDKWITIGWLKKKLQSTQHLKRNSVEIVKAFFGQLKVNWNFH